MTVTAQLSYFQQRMAEIDADPRLRRPVKSMRRHLVKETTRYGKTKYYFRLGKGPRIRLPDPKEVGEAAFQRAYEAAFNGEPSPILRDRRDTPTYMKGIGKLGYVYFIKMGRSIKIGFSTNVEKRLKALQTGCPEPAEVIKAIPGSQNSERYFHEHFATYRLTGEWFSLEGDLAVFLSVNVS